MLRRDSVLGIEVELDLDLIANGNRRCHLVLMKENIITGIPRSSIKKNTLVIHAHGRKFHDIANAVTANGLDAGRFFFGSCFSFRFHISFRRGIGPELFQVIKVTFRFPEDMATQSP